MRDSFEKQWDMLMNKSAFNEEAELIMPSEEISIVKGHFHSGTYAKENYAPYQSERLQGEERDYFSVSILSLPSLYRGEKDELKNCKLVSKDGDVFLIHSVSGKSKGNYLLQLKESD